MKKQNLYKTIPLSIGVLVVSFAISYIILAWTEPPTAPPGDNVDAPINVSDVGQYKEGELGVATNSFNPNFGLTVGSSTNPKGIKVTGDSKFSKGPADEGGIVVGDATDGNMGGGSINAEALYVNGQPVGGGGIGGVDVTYRIDISSYKDADTQEFLHQTAAYACPGDSIPIDISKSSTVYNWSWWDIYSKKSGSPFDCCSYDISGSTVTATIWPMHNLVSYSGWNCGGAAQWQNRECSEGIQGCQGTWERNYDYYTNNPCTVKFKCGQEISVGEVTP